MMYAYALAGLTLLFAGGDGLVRGAVSLARRFGLSPLLIGLTVVAFCTSAPELVVSVEAALEGSSNIAIGNVVGSNIFNVLAVGGAAALVAPIVVRPGEMRRDSIVLVASALAVALVSQTGEISRLAGAVLTTALVAHIVVTYRLEVNAPSTTSAEVHAHKAEQFDSAPSIWPGLGFTAVGLAALVIGAQLLILGATDIARTLGISESVIGLSLVAFGTSLPELATTVVASLRGRSDVAVGNVVGSSIFNALGILGITALVRPIGVAERIAQVDVWVMVAVSVALAALLLIHGRITRSIGAIAVVLYASYIATLFA